MPPLRGGHFALFPSLFSWCPSLFFHDLCPPLTLDKLPFATSPRPRVSPRHNFLQFCFSLTFCSPSGPSFLPAPPPFFSSGHERLVFLLVWWPLPLFPFQCREIGRACVSYLISTAVLSNPNGSLCPFRDPTRSHS